MRRTKLVLAATAAVVTMLALTAGPALADDNHDFFPSDHFSNAGFVSGDLQQEADSGDVNQSFDVSQTGDNSNQCVNASGVANTGNVQTQTSDSQFGNGFDDFHHGDRFFNDGFRGFFNRFGLNDFQSKDSGSNGSDLSVTGNSTVTCDQQVNQAAAAG